MKTDVANISPSPTYATFMFIEVLNSRIEDNFLTYWYRKLYSLYDKHLTILSQIANIGKLKQQRYVLGLLSLTRTRPWSWILFSLT